MIPKIIHFCWLSDDPYPEQIQKCINSWKEVMPDYEFIKWDRTRFDVDSVPYVKEAFKAKKYAFCADYIRIYALYTMGGIYLDSDVLVYKSFNPFLHHKSFSSIEFHSYFLYAHISNKKERLVGIEAAVLGAEKGSDWLKDILDYYHSTSFSLRKSSIKKNIMPRVIARILHKKYGFEYIPSYQCLKNDYHIYPSEVFSSNDTNNSPIKYSSHLGANSWGYNKTNIMRDILKTIGLLKIIRRIRGIQHKE